MEQVIGRLFDYDDFRVFLKDYFEEQKKLKPVFSHRFFAAKAGFSSSSYCLNVIRGRFNFTVKSIEKFSKAVSFTDLQKSYFFALVFYNQAVHPEERDHAWNQILKIRQQLEFTQIQHEQQDYFSKWYYPVLRELVVHLDWKGDYIKLARSLDPPITTEEARLAVKKLIEWALIEKSSDDTYKTTSHMLNAQKIPPIALRQIRREYIQHAIGSIESKGKDERFSTFTTLTMSEESYRYAVQVLEEARQKIISRAASDMSVEKIYELMVVLYPMSKAILKEGGPSE